MDKTLKQKIAEAYKDVLDECDFVTVNYDNVDDDLKYDINDIKLSFGNYVALVEIENKINKEAISFWKAKCI
jgi:hypothetical protein